MEKRIFYSFLLRKIRIEIVDKYIYIRMRSSEGQSRRKRNWDHLGLWWASSKLNTRNAYRRLDAYNQAGVHQIQSKIYIYMYTWKDSSTLARSRGTKCCVKVWLGSRGMSWIIQGSRSVDGGKTIDLQVKRTRVSYLVKWKKNEGKENENWLHIYSFRIV